MAEASEEIMSDDDVVRDSPPAASDDEVREEPELAFDEFVYEERSSSPEPESVKSTKPKGKKTIAATIETETTVGNL
jgi:hypothetical protein